MFQLTAFRRLLLAYTLNELAWAIGPLALSYVVYRRTGSAFGAAGFYLCSQFVPSLMAPLVVSRLDRRSVRTVLPVLYSTEALISLVLAGLVRHFSLVPILVLVVVDGTLALAARPLARATNAALTAPLGLLREGNGIINTCFSIAVLVGPAAGGVLVATAGASAALLLNVGLFIIIAATIATCRTLPAPAAATTSQGGRIRAAFRYARANRPIRLLLMVQAGALVFFTMSIPVEVVYAQHSLHAGAGGYGALLAAWGAGAVLGSMLYLRWRAADPRTLVALSAGLVAVGFTGMALAPSLPLALVSAGVAGVANGVEVVAARTAIQEHTEAGWMALVLSFNDSMSQATPGLGIIIGGTVAGLLGPRAALGVGAAGALLIAGASWALLRPPRPVMRPLTGQS